jgi:hypothetical protein
MKFREVLSIIALTAFVGGCGYVSSNELERALCLIDEDGDGAPRGGAGCSEFGLVWVDSNGDEQPISDTIVDCDDQPQTIPDNEGELHIKGQLRTPFTPDIPYDGIDNDCVGGDNVDADGDSYPGLQQNAWRNNFIAKWSIDPSCTGEECETEIDIADWPSTVLFEPDCVDQDIEGLDIAASDIHPNNGDTPYNGVDEDCGKDNDFDADGDGHASKFHKEEHDAAYGNSTSDNSIWLESDDCDDARSDVNPDEAPGQDVPYDGRDKACNDFVDGAFVQNDFDADGDGWMPYGVEEAFARYIETYQYEAMLEVYTDEEGNLKVGDCHDKSILNDGEDPKPGEANYLPNPSSIHPGTVDPKYDGIDHDCSDIQTDEEGNLILVGNDLDLDNDGYMRTDEADTNFLLYRKRYFDYQWPEQGIYPYRELFDAQYGDSDEDALDYFAAFVGDCRDDGPGAASVNPSALEVLGNAVDEDCDTDGTGTSNDIARFNFSLNDSSFFVSNASRPRVASADNHFIVVAAANQVDLGLGLPPQEKGVAFFLPKGQETSNLAAYDQYTWWAAAEDENFNGEIGGIHVYGNHFTVGFSYTTPSLTFLRMQQNLLEDGTESEYSASPDNEKTYSRAGVHSYTGVDFQFDPGAAKDPKLGSIWMVGCNDDGIQYAGFTHNGEQLTSVGQVGDSSTVSLIDPTGQDCFIQTPPYVGTGAANWVHMNTIDGTTGEISTYQVNMTTELSSSPSTPWDGYTIDEAISNDNWLILTDRIGDIVDIILDDDNSETFDIPADIIQVDATWRDSDGDGIDDTLYLAAILDVGGNLQLALIYGDPDSTMNVVADYKFQNTDGANFVSNSAEDVTITPEGIAISSDNEQVVIVATGTLDYADGSSKEYLGWSVLGAP